MCKKVSIERRAVRAILFTAFTRTQVEYIMKNYKEEFDDTNMSEEYGSLGMASDELQRGLQGSNGNGDNDYEICNGDDPDERYGIETNWQRSSFGTRN